MATISYKQTSHAVLNVLKKYTDEEHRIKQQDIIELVRQETGQVHVRKSIRKDLNELIAAGYPIRYEKGWYYEHEFCPGELNLIVDSLRTAAGITASQRDELIRKISRLGGDWYAKDENNKQLRPNNPQFLYALDVLHIAPIISVDDSDEYAKRYDNTIYAMMLDALDGGKDLRKVSKKLTSISALLATKGTIGQVAQKMPLIQATADSDYWVSGGITDYEHARNELRALIKFLSDIIDVPLVFSKLDDKEIERVEGGPLPASDDFVDYRAKVNRYVNEHGNTLVIHKLTHNIPLTEGEYSQLEHILTTELGSKDDYEKAFHDTPFGILIRKIAGMDHDAVMAAFADFIESEHLNTQQINFVNKVIAYVEKNGYIKDMGDLLKPPFDKPTNFFILFDDAKQRHLVQAINNVRENAERHMA